MDGSPWAAGGAAGGGSGPTAPFDADLQARVAALTDRVEELTEAAVRGRKEVPCARRDARDEREVLRRKVQAALDARAERRRRRARRSLLKQVAAEPLPRLPGAERRDEQADTLNAALLDVEQLELVRRPCPVFARLRASSAHTLTCPDLTRPCRLPQSLPQQSLAARQATELIKRLAAPQAEGDDGH